MLTTIRRIHFTVTCSFIAFDLSTSFYFLLLFTFFMFVLVRRTKGIPVSLRASFIRYPQILFVIGKQAHAHFLGWYALASQKLLANWRLCIDAFFTSIPLVWIVSIANLGQITTEAVADLRRPLHSNLPLRFLLCPRRLQNSFSCPHGHPIPSTTCFSSRPTTSKMRTSKILRI